MKRFAEFFAGIGLVRAGLARTGWQCAYANDIEEKKRQMYVDHFGDSPEYQLGDIWDAAAVLARIPNDLTMATASFPCTDLSLAGHWRGIDGKHSSTFFAFVDVLQRLGTGRPPILLVENVVGFVKSNDGGDFSRACQELAALGYWMDAIVLDAKAFVPQSRPRVFLVGVQPSLRHHALFAPLTDLFNQSTDFAEPQFDAHRPSPLQNVIAKTKLSTGWLNSRLPFVPSRKVELHEVLNGGDDQEWWTDAKTGAHLESMQEPSLRRLRQLKDEPTVSLGTAFRRTRLKITRTEIRFDIAGCLRTPRGGSARQIVVRVGRGEIRFRWMTPVEYARLQGIGDYHIKVPAQQALFGFGDAVCVPAISWLDEHLLTPLATAAITAREKADRGHILAS